MILAGVLALLFLGYLAIAVHELGHYLAYRRYGVPVEGVYIGGPPWILRWRRGGTEYRLGLLPLFGAVASKWEEVDRLPPGRVLGLFLSGPLFSFLAGVLGFLALGVMKGNLVAVGKVLLLILVFPFILLQNLYQALFLDLPEMGAVPLVQASGQVLVSHGLEGLLVLWGVFNIVLFWFNLLPVPPLDGGQAVFLLFRHRAWFDRVYPYVLGFGFAVLFALFELALLKDVVRLWGGGR